MATKNPYYTKLAKLHWIALTAIVFGVAFYFTGELWTRYTIAHSANPRIDFNFASALLTLLGCLLVLVSLISLMVALLNRKNKD